jgi:hypothetical protein
VIPSPIVLRFGAASAALAIALASAGAGAQPSQTSAAAATLFDRGLADMQAGNYQAGCPALRESYRLDPRPGSLFTAAECEANWGKIAAALAGYTDFVALVERMSEKEQTAHAKRAAIAAEQKARLAAIVPKLVLVLSAGAGAGTTVELDGTLLGRPSLGVALPVDPGEHRIVVKTADGEREEKVTIAVSEEKRVELEAAAPKPKPPPPVVQLPAVEPKPDGPKRRPFAYAAFALGAVGLGAGALGGGLTLAAKSTIDAHCTGIHCNAEGKSAADRAQVTGALSTVGFITGGAGLTLGVLLWVTDPVTPARSRTGVALGLGPAPLAVVGRF